MKLKGADILINCLLEQGVDTIFGYPGGAVLDIYDALYRNGKINHILTAHEQGAAHAADGYARSTGKVGVCFATSGPGATNLVTGIATAYMDSIPLVAVTGNVGINFLGRDSFQEVDICGITMPITKHNFIVKDVKDLAETIRRAFYIANSGRKGPVLIDILKNVQVAECEYEPAQPYPLKEFAIDEEKVAKTAEIINSAKKPLIIAGGGVIASDASHYLKEFAKKLNAPVTYTLMGKGAIADGDPLCIGMLGMHGTVSAAKSLIASDVIIALGTRFSDRVALNRDLFANGKKVIHIDIDNAEFDKNVKTSIRVLADIETYLKTVHNQLSAIFNHAARFYGLNLNPARQAGNMGAEERKEMLFWTREEYTKFSEAMMDKPLSFYAFEVLYWCGIREGELLALTPADFDFEKRTLTINKSYQRLNKQDVITTPKTPKSNRVIQMPQFLCDELQDYLKQLYGVEPDSRMFPISKSYLHREMDRGCKQTGVKRIRIHDLRHSHISLLIDMGFTALAIAERVGHESIDITYRYAHLFPTRQVEMADKLDSLKNEKGV